MERLPYDVIIWHREQSSPLELHERIIERAGRHPDEGCEMQGFCDMHWGFQTPQQATEFAESMFEFATLDDVVLLVISAPQDETFDRKVYKDTKSSIKVSATLHAQPHMPEPPAPASPHSPS